MSLVIRPMEADDLEVFGEHFRSEYGRTHADDLMRQDHEEILFLTAWIGAKPVGHAFLNWVGGRDAAIADLYPNHPELYRLFISEAFQSRGLGTQLIGACEQAVRNKGYPGIGLGVAHANDAAYKLYKRLGYEEAEPSAYIDSYQHALPDGRVVTIKDTCRWMLKSL